MIEAIVNLAVFGIFILFSFLVIKFTSKRTIQTDSNFTLWFFRIWMITLAGLLIYIGYISFKINEL